MFHVLVRAGWLLRLAIDFNFIVFNADPLSELIARPWGLAEFDTPGINSIMSGATDVEVQDVMRVFELSETLRTALKRVHTTDADANMYHKTLFLEPSRLFNSSQRIALLESLLTALQARSGSARDSFASSATAQGAGSEPAQLDGAENGPSQDGIKHNGIKRTSKGNPRRRPVHSITKEMAQAYERDFPLLTKNQRGKQLDPVKYRIWFLTRAQAGEFGEKYMHMTEGDDIPLAKSIGRSRVARESASSRSSEIAKGGPQIFDEPAAQNIPPPTPQVTSSSDVESHGDSFTDNQSVPLFEHGPQQLLADVNFGFEHSDNDTSTADSDADVHMSGSLDRSRPPPDAAASSPGKRLKVSDDNFKAESGTTLVERDRSSPTATAGSTIPEVSPISSLALGIMMFIRLA
jgi:hypothetical protein